MVEIKKKCVKCGNSRTYLNSNGECGDTYKSGRKCLVRERENGMKANNIQE